MAHSSVSALTGNSGVSGVFSAGLGSDVPVPTQNAMKAKPRPRIPMAKSSVFTLLGPNVL